ncbi:Na/Pi symporter [Egicoccus halophilus]|uniref:Sodium:phosphate symporter n=1 Tax=Egicoccus halophilus TaxID=1670830 RepID=A0A8J3ACF4_9ACTN|nr:Na/Pi symporter [Egicoccus halophilus]GGI05017.1 sodium:phosphate symporter [Egicoccus halophilus]
MAESSSRAAARRDLPTPLRALLVVALLYAFLAGVGLLESGIAALGDGFQEGLLTNVANPVSGLFAGILFTVLVQSSSVSTSTIVGLVGAGTLSVPLAVPMIMGANIGTTVTNTLASLGNIRRSDEFRRGFAGATMHDFFNVLAVAVLLPIELATGFLAETAEWLTVRLRGTEVAEVGTSPIRTAVKFPVELVEGLFDGDPLGGRFAGVIYLTLGLALIFLALGLITRNMRELVAGGVERAMNRLVGRGGGAMGILVGIAVTVAVQSSTITTSILVPLVAAGILTLPNAYPITLGANVGTTITALLASLAVLRPEGLTIALVHTLFNLLALAVVYPVPKLRLVPVRLAERLADLAVRRRSVVFGYVLGLFLVVPLLGVFLIP